MVQKTHRYYANLAEFFITSACYHNGCRGFGCQNPGWTGGAIGDHS